MSSPPASEFDEYGETYADAVERAIAFSGADHGFFTRAKVRELLALTAGRRGAPRRRSVHGGGGGPGGAPSGRGGRG
ncbi:MAG: class I SAM-dependent methyltransferase, partial [Solirubrobacterales bacterium]